jgi:hypothetical protein
MLERVNWDMVSNLFLKIVYHFLVSEYKEYKIYLGKN